MFHVATLLPLSKEDLQQVEKKRHIGNDICVIIFKDGFTPFSPNMLTSEFNHVFAVVQRFESTDKVPLYRMEIATKDGVPAFGPPVYGSHLFIDPQLFKEALLTKLINGEQSSYTAPQFRQKIQRVRQEILTSIVKEIPGS